MSSDSPSDRQGFPDPGSQQDASIVWTPELIRVLAGLMLALLLAAMDATIVATALPTITKDLGGFQFYPWVVSGYLLTSTTTIPIWGKAADLYGRRRMLMLGVVLFILTSILCGFASGMLPLIIFRLLQGIGAGSLQTVVMTLASDLVPMRQRMRIQGFLSGMWVTAAILAPVLGAFFVSTVGWRWIFGVNVPVGLAAVALIAGYREPPLGRREIRINPAGVILLTGGIGLLLVGAGSASTRPTPNPPLLLLALACLAAFVVVELKSVSPTVPIRLTLHPVVGPALALGAISSTVRSSITTYLPLFVQGVLGAGAYAGGLALIPMSVIQAVASALGGWYLLRIGYFRLTVFGSVMLVSGTVAMSLAGGAGLMAAAGGLVGLGVGMFNAPTLIVIQSWASREEKGSITAFRQLSQTLGGAIGVALLGIVVQIQVERGAGGARAHEGLGAGIHDAFFALVVLALLSVLLARLAVGRQVIGNPSGAR